MALRTEPDSRWRLVMVFVVSFLGCHAPEANDTATNGPALRLQSTPFQPPFDWVGIIGTGQSLSVGCTAKQIIDTTPSFHNLRLEDSRPDVSQRYGLTGGQWSVVGLSEPPREYVAPHSATAGAYPNNLHGETPHTALASELTELGQKRGSPDYVSVHSVVGWAGHCIRSLNKEGFDAGVVGPPYPASIHEAQVFKQLADSAGKTFGYGAIILTHGECDDLNPDYGDQIFQMQQDYNQDLGAITGQTATVPLFLTQQSTKVAQLNGNAKALGSALEALDISRAHPDDVVCVGPKYQWEYSPDHLHLTSGSYRALGEKYAEAIDHVVNGKARFVALTPTSTLLSGQDILVGFHVPHPPMLLDITFPAPHQHANAAWANGAGFEAVDSTGPLTIRSVSITGDVVDLRLVSTPAGTGLRVRYAVVQDGDPETNQGGLPTGLRGQLRDSDELLGADHQTFTCTTTQGSAVLDCMGADLSARTSRDRVLASGLAGGEASVAAIQGMRVTLTAPWTGPSGPASIQFAYDLRNWGVHFDYPVPYRTP